MSPILLTIGAPLTIVPRVYPQTVGAAGHVEFAAAGHVGIARWMLIDSTLPAEWDTSLTVIDGVASLAASEVLDPSGSPYSVTLRLLDLGSRQAVERTFWIRVVALPLSYSGDLSTWHVGSAISDTLTVTGGSGVYSLSVHAGELPAGAAVALSGADIEFSGTPTTEESWDITLRVTDSLGSSLDIALGGTVGEAAPVELWTPEHLSTPPGVWLAPESDVTLQYGVHVWDDRSGNGRHFAQAATTRQPAESAAAINGLRAVTFDGVDDYLDAPSSALSIARAVDEVYVAAVYRLDADSPSDPVIFSATTGTANVSRVYLAAGASSTETISWGGRRLDGDSWSGIGSPLAYLDEWVIVVGILRYATREMELWVNGSLVASATDQFSAAGPSSDTDSTSMRIGAIASTSAISSAWYLPGKLPEIVVGGGDALYEGDVDKVTGYLAHKYALQSALPVDHPYKDAPPTVEPITFAGDPLPAAADGGAYSETLTVSGGTAPYSLGTVAGVPAGLSVGLAGDTITLSGTPSAGASSGSPYSLSIEVTDALSANGVFEQSFEVGEEELDTETLTWISRIEALGGSVTSGEITIADDLIKAIKAESFNAKILYLLPLIGESIAAHRVPLRDALDVGAATLAGSVPFTDSNCATASGLTNSTEQHAGLDTGLTPADLDSVSTLSNINGGLGFWERDIGFGSGVEPIGCYDAAGSPDYRYLLDLRSSMKYLRWGSPSGAPAGAGTSAASAHYYGQKSSNTSRKLFEDGVLVHENTSSVNSGSGGADTNICVMGSLAASGSTLYAWKGRCAVAYLTDGSLSDAEAADMHALLNTYLITPTGR
jgi:hypothetical protein